MSPEKNMNRKGTGDTLHYESIKRALHKEENVDLFVTRLQEWIDGLKEESSYFRRPEVLKPRSAESLALVQKVLGTTRRLRENVNELAQSPACRTVHDREPVKRMTDELGCFAELLRGMARNVAPRPRAGTNSRLSLERYALRGLMWLWKIYFPSVAMSYASESRFYRSADHVLQLIGTTRKDIRRLIKQENANFIEFLQHVPLPNRADILESKSKIVIPIWHKD